MKHFFGLLYLALLANAPRLEALSLSASVYERFYTSSSFSFGSDGAARLRRDLVDRGFERFTVNLRLAYSEQGNQFYAPIPRSSRSAVEDIIVGAVHDEMKVVLRPVLVEDPSAEVLKPKIASLLSVRDMSRMVDSLDRYYAVYASILRKYDAEEFVMPTGLSFLLTKEGLPHLNRLARSIRLRSNFTRVRLSLEVSTEEIAILSQSREALGAGEFDRLLEPFSRIRLLLPDQMGVQSIRNLSSIDSALRSSRAELEKLLPGRDYVLANLTLPSCVEFVVLGEGRLDCAVGSKTLEVSLQASRLDDMLKAQAELAKSLPWAYLELNYGLTDVEPKSWEPFSEFLIWNSYAKKVIERFLKDQKSGPDSPRGMDLP